MAVPSRLACALALACAVTAGVRQANAQWVTQAAQAAPVSPAAQAAVPVLRPDVLGEIPHDPAAFTQGLLWLDGTLYESTGLYGESSLRALDPRTGAVTRRVAVPARYFAEGLAWYRGSFWQLTWREQQLLRWPRDFGGDGKTSGPSGSQGSLRYAGEGWGLATLVTGRDTALWMSNGSDTLYRRVVKNGAFTVTGKVPVRLQGRPLARLNELEGARGKIVANVWYSDSLFVIDPRDGRVTAVIDGGALAARSGRRSFHDVMNGVAWDPVKDEFYLTGKNWPKMFRVKLPAF